MPRVAFEDFADKEVARIYIAGELAEGKRVENALSANDVDYAVEVEPYMNQFVFLVLSERASAAFYVILCQAELCRRVLREAGLERGIVEEPVSGS